MKTKQMGLEPAILTTQSTAQIAWEI